jgi:SIT4-associating protein SAP185/190
VVYDVVQQVFNGPIDRFHNRALTIDLFNTGDITRAIVNGQRRNDVLQQHDRMRLGYMGHLTLIAEEVVKFTERHPPVEFSGVVLEQVTDPEWLTYVEVTLSETRERDNAILGGSRPEAGMAAQQIPLNAGDEPAATFTGQSSVLAEAGLSGLSNLDDSDLPHNLNRTAFVGQSSAGLLSEFGSSSDEEDDDIEEPDDDEKRDATTAEVRILSYRHARFAAIAVVGQSFRRHCRMICEACFLATRSTCADFYTVFSIYHYAVHDDGNIYYRPRHF